MNKIFLNNVGDLAEAQRASFYKFLSTGITEELENFPNPFNSKIKILGKKKNHFSYINNSGKNLSKILENFSQKKISKFIIKPKYRKNYLKSRIAEYYNYFNYLFSMVINRLKSY